MAGKFDIKLVHERGFINFPDCEGGDCPASSITFDIEEFALSSGQNTGLAGGNTLQLTGKGVNTLYPNQNKVIVCGHPCVIDESTLSFTNIECKLPQINSQFILDNNYVLG